MGLLLASTYELTDLGSVGPFMATSWGLQCRGCQMVPQSRGFQAPNGLGAKWSWAQMILGTHVVTVP